MKLWNYSQCFRKTKTQESDISDPHADLHAMFCRSSSAKQLPWSSRGISHFSLPFVLLISLSMKIHIPRPILVCHDISLLFYMLCNSRFALLISVWRTPWLGCVKSSKLDASICGEKSFGNGMQSVKPLPCGHEQRSLYSLRQGMNFHEFVSTA